MAPAQLVLVERMGEEVFVHYPDGRVIETDYIAFDTLGLRELTRAEEYLIGRTDAEAEVMRITDGPRCPECQRGMIYRHHVGPDQQPHHYCEACDISRPADTIAGDETR